VVLENVLAVHGETLFIGGGGDGQVFFLLAPSDREGVVGPQSDGRNVQVCVLTRAEPPRASHADSHAEGVSGKDFNVTTGTTVSNIAHDEADESPGALHDPESKYAVEHKLLRPLLEMDPHSAECNGSTDDVTVQEHLIEGVTHW
jgi:hypothetical protein